MPAKQGFMTAMPQPQQTMQGGASAPAARPMPPGSYPTGGRTDYSATRPYPSSVPSNNATTRPMPFNPATSWAGRPAPGRLPPAAPVPTRDPRRGAPAPQWMPVPAAAAPRGGPVRPAPYVPPGQWGGRAPQVANGWRPQQGQLNWQQQQMRTMPPAMRQMYNRRPVTAQPQAMQQQGLPTQRGLPVASRVNLQGNQLNRFG